MRLIVTAAALTGLAAAALLPAQADAQSRSRYTSRDGTVIVSRDENGRTRTRIIVQRRSFLDGGTEVAPGERKYRDYVEGPTSWMPYQVIDNTARSHRSPLPGPFTLPFNSNPMQP